MSLITFTVPPEQTEAANQWLLENEQNKILRKIRQHAYIYSQADIDWCDTEACNDPAYFKSFFTDNYGLGEAGANSIDLDLLEEHGIEEDDVPEMLTALLETFTGLFKVMYRLESCNGFNKNEWFFSLDQVRRITRSGMYCYIRSDDEDATSEDLLFLIKNITYEQRYLIGNVTDEATSTALTLGAEFIKKNNDQFYPTPPDLIEKMLGKIKKPGNVRSILEPSAGKGDIVRAIQEKASRRYGRAIFADAEIKAIELDEDLQALLRGKHGISVIESNFLTYAGLEMFDCIVMNPPFSTGAQHLLKAIEITFAGQIVCLLNAATLKNPFSNERKMLVEKLKEHNAEIEYLTGAFGEAERKTNVEVAIVYLEIKREVEKDLFDDLSEGGNEFDDIDPVEDEFEVATRNEIANLVRKYQRERIVVSEHIIGFYKNYHKVSRYMRLAMTDEKSDDSFSRQQFNASATLTELMVNKLNAFSKRIKENYWREALSLDEFSSKLTTRKRKEMEYLLKSFYAMEFSEANVRQLLVNIIERYPRMLQESIEKLFEDFTAHALRCKARNQSGEYLNSIHYFNGWKTNDAYRINKKVIMPFYGIDEFMGFKLKWDQRDFLQDIEQTMDYLSGDAYERSLFDVVDEAMKAGQNRKIETKYFWLSIYKKGTIHFEFRDLELLKRLNIEACKNKSFLPDDYATKPYESLSEEEKEVVEAFEGKENYSVVPSFLDSITMAPAQTMLGHFTPEKNEVEKPIEELAEEQLIIDKSAEIEMAESFDDASYGGLFGLTA